MTDRAPLESPGVSAAPSWFDEPVPEKRLLWTCWGNYPKPKWHQRLKNKPPARRWKTLFTSKQEAEAHASIPHESGWVWDGKEARYTSLDDTMMNARRLGLLGVKVKSYQNGQWIEIARYPADVPLSERELEQ